VNGVNGRRHSYSVYSRDQPSRWAGTSEVIQKVVGVPAGAPPPGLD
jgi:hypothetical protein